MPINVNDDCPGGGKLAKSAKDRSNSHKDMSLEAYFATMMAFVCQSENGGVSSVDSSNSDESAEENNNTIQKLLEDEESEIKELDLNPLSTPQYLAQNTSPEYSQVINPPQQGTSEDAPPQDDDDPDNEPPPTGRVIGVCEAKFREKQNDMGLLFSMAYGLKASNGRVVVDWDAEPYNSFKKVSKKTFKPSKDQLWDEIEARAKALDIALPRIKSQGMDMKKVWLVENPWTNIVDVAFLLEKEAHFMETCKAAEAEAAAQRDTASASGAKWSKIET